MVHVQLIGFRVLASELRIVACYIYFTFLLFTILKSSYNLGTRHAFASAYTLRKNIFIFIVVTFLEVKIMSLSPTLGPMDVPSSPDLPMSSPQLPKLPSPTRARIRSPKKERRPTSITPRRFKRFFDNKAATTSMSSPSGRALKEMVNNRQGTQSSPLKPLNDMDPQGQENEELISTPREFKRRKTNHSNLSPDDECLFKDPVGTHHGQSHRSAFQKGSSYLKSHSIFEQADEEKQDEEEEEDMNEPSLPKEPTERIIPFENRGLSARLLQLSLGTSRSRRANLTSPVNGNIFTTLTIYLGMYLLM